MPNPPSDALHSMECESCSMEITLLHAQLKISDELIAKGLLVKEMAQIARAEVRMRELLLKKWDNRAKQAAVKAGSAAAQGAKLAGIMGAVDKVLDRWDDDVGPSFALELESVYRLARIAAWKRATKQSKTPLAYTVPNFAERAEQIQKAVDDAPKLAVLPTFDLFDESAILALQDDQMLWIGEHYRRNVRDVIREATREKLEKGIGRSEAGRQIRDLVEKKAGFVKVPTGGGGSQARYFEGLSANAATTGRVRGAIRSFVDTGVTRYTLSNPQDRRTSPQCRFMDGKVFTVQQATRHIERTAGATSPDEIRAAHPWVSAKVLRSTFGKGGAGGAKRLATGGHALPPYHFRCRTTVDISSDSFTELTSVERIKPMSARKAPKKGRRRPTTKPKRVSAAQRAATIPPEK